MKATDKEVQAGIAFYTKFGLRSYEWMVRIYCRFMWKCSPGNMLALYDEHVSSNHLDVGPGTGYFLKKCKFPVTGPRVALMDLNSKCLEFTAKRIKHYEPEIYQGNILEPMEPEMKPFDSVAIMNILHCLPGNLNSKAAVFGYLKEVMNPGAILFGSTLLGKGVSYNFWARGLLRIANKKGIFTNYEDDYQSLKEGLEEHFQDTSIKLVGGMALFSAQK